MQPDRPWLYPIKANPSPWIIGLLKGIGDLDLEKGWAIEIIKAAYAAEQSDCEHHSDQNDE